MICNQNLLSPDKLLEIIQRGGKGGVALQTHFSGIFHFFIFILILIITIKTFAEAFSRKFIFIV